MTSKLVSFFIKFWKTNYLINEYASSLSPQVPWEVSETTPYVSCLWHVRKADDLFYLLILMKQEHFYWMKLSTMWEVEEERNTCSREQARSQRQTREMDTYSRESKGLSKLEVAALKPESASGKTYSGKPRRPPNKELKHRKLKKKIFF